MFHGSSTINNKRKTRKLIVVYQPHTNAKAVPFAGIPRTQLLFVFKFPLLIHQAYALGINFFAQTFVYKA